ncbi:MAG: FHA domain-containing protein [Pseudomonadota bacterium]|nr:FHA domain-containing protein [Pseudomonadota bacterium]
MSTYIKVCPKCGHHNPEYENACAACPCFIGMETPVPAPSSASEPAHTSAGVLEHQSADQAPSTTVTPPQTAPAQLQSTLYLQVLGSDRIFEVRDGWTVGQSHASSTAELQLRDLPGIRYLHRNHCRFSCVNGDWQITPTDQRQFGRDFTNPTAANHTTLTPGEAHSIKNGDQLSLANLKVVVRII